VQRCVPNEAPLIVAGDFNDWGERLHIPVADIGLHTESLRRVPTFPARAPLLYLDRIYGRGLKVSQLHAPRGQRWWRMSDHLPLISLLEAESQSKERP
jgi:endonuclease/exonuclease/phosphatase family metal-dependent hydrolase